MDPRNAEWIEIEPATSVIFFILLIEHESENPCSGATSYRRETANISDLH